MVIYNYFTTVLCTRCTSLYKAKSNEIRNNNNEKKKRELILFNIKLRNDA